MTSLFFVMLVLFVLVVVLLHNKIEATQKQLDKINEIEESIKNINKEYFAYDPLYKRHTLKNIDVAFRTGSFNIDDIPKEQQGKLLKVGFSIKCFVDSVIIKNPKVKYILIIEGQSSKDDYYKNECNNNDVLSYQRALTLLKFWERNDVKFNSDYCEAIISGSGQNSPFRVQPDNKFNKANQRFVIHIIPKIGIIEQTKK
jgi:hypothetical protein